MPRAKFIFPQNAGFPLKSVFLWNLSRFRPGNPNFFRVVNMSKTFWNSRKILLIFPKGFCIIRAEALQNKLCNSKNIHFGNEVGDA